jgi:hypothetical protein
MLQAPGGESVPIVAGDERVQGGSRVEVVAVHDPGDPVVVAVGLLEARAQLAIDLVSQAAVVKSGAALATAAPQPMVADTTGSPVGHLSRIGLRRFDAGEYELCITVTDRNARATVSRTVTFTVN